ncbi:MAG: nucleotide pyrophosphohydrolase [Myxococcota bacterium]
MEDSRSEMSIREIQEHVDAWISQWDDGYWAPHANLARLTEEVGELAREINDVHGPKKKKEDEAEGRIADELADILFVVVTLANSLDIDLQVAFEQVMDKYDARDADRWSRDDG